MQQCKQNAKKISYKNLQCFQIWSGIIYQLQFGSVWFVGV